MKKQNVYSLRPPFHLSQIKSLVSLLGLNIPLQVFSLEGIHILCSWLVSKYIFSKVSI